MKLPQTTSSVNAAIAYFLFGLCSVSLCGQAYAQVEALSHSELMRSCPVESSLPIPNHVIRAAASIGDVSSQARYVTPLHVHILQDTQGTNRVTRENVEATLARLNSGFTKAGFTFTLASLETVVNDTWARVARADIAVLQEVAAALNVGGRDSVNVYIGFIESLCGRASLPYYQYTHEAVYLDYRCIPGGETSEGYDTVIHEMGHYMGLFHTFSPEPNGCRGRGDFVADTPFQKVPHFRCKKYDTCPKKPGLDPVRNFMDYTDDACTNHFTKGQIALMRYAHWYYRLR
ncbi:MAG: M43 family zinc metalloprotease [Pseudomonadota bacterium]|jgi:hypothetical protein